MRTNALHHLIDDGGLRFEEAEIGIEHFAFWRGGSGRRYLATVYSIDAVPDYSEAVVLFVHRGSDGRRTALFIEQVEAPFTADRLSLVREARLMGANEVHMHFLAQAPAHRRRAMLDIMDAASALHPHETVRAA